MPGRFVSADTVVPEAGEPQGLNRYAYVYNNPLRYTDPSGHWTFEEEPGDPYFIGPWLYEAQHRRDFITPREPTTGEFVAVATSPFWAPALAVGVTAPVTEGAAPPVTAAFKFAIAHPLEAAIAKAVAEEAFEATVTGTPFDPANVALDVLTQVGDDFPRRRYSQYSVAYEMELAPADYGASRAIHHRRASAALHADLQSYPEFAADMESLIPGVTDAAAAGRSPVNWRWHHAGSPTDPRGVRMQLVPESQHLRGSPWWDVLHPGGVGGWYRLRRYRQE